MSKKSLLFVITLIIAVGSFLRVKGQEPTEIHTEIDIQAPIEIVWALLIDINKWAQWSPIINDSKGFANHGSMVTITMVGKESGVDGPTYQPTIIVFEPPTHLRWSADMMASFVMKNDKVIILEKITTGTRVIHKEVFTGMMVPIFGSTFEHNVPPMLDLMNQALKEKAENISF